MANPGPATSADVLGTTSVLTSEIGTIAAAGSSLATGTAITTATTYVTGADGTKGVVLPLGQIGQQYLVFNNAAAILKVYPSAATTAINGGSAGASVSIAANKAGHFVMLTATGVGAIYS